MKNYGHIADIHTPKKLLQHHIPTELSEQMAISYNALQALAGGF